jgi:hypothetical protein
VCTICEGRSCNEVGSIYRQDQVPLVPAGNPHKQHYSLLPLLLSRSSDVFASYELPDSYSEGLAFGVLSYVLALSTIYVGESCIPGICRREIPILISCTPSREDDDSPHHCFPALDRISSDAIHCNLRPPSLSLSLSLSLSRWPDLYSDDL